MSVLLTSLSAVAGVFVFAGCNHLQAAPLGLQRRTHRLFAALCFLTGLGAATCIAVFQAPQIADRVAGLRWVLVSVIAINAVFPWFIADYLEARSKAIPIALSALSALLLLADLTMPYGLWFASMPAAQARQLPWGEVFVGYVPVHTFNVWRTLFWIHQAIFFGYCVTLCIRQFRSGHQRRPLVLGAGMLVLVLAVCSDWLVTFGYSSIPAAGLFGFLALVLLMSWDLHYEQRQHTKQMQAVLDHVPAVVYVKDLDGRYLFVNRHFKQLFHHVATHWIGRTDAELFAPATAELLGSHDKEVLTTGQAQRFEEVLEKDGTSHTYLALKFPLNAASIFPSAPYAIAAIATDITERMRTEHALRSSEAQTRLVLDAAEQGIMGVDMNGRCSFVNHAVVNLLGYEQPQQLQGRLVCELLGYVATDKESEAVSQLKLTLLSGVSVRNATGTCYRNDGTSFAVEYSSQPIRSKGQVIGAVLSFADISERNRVDEAVRALAEASSSLNSDAFFQYCVRSLADVYGAEYAMIGLFNDERSVVRTVAACVRGQIVANYQYEIADSPYTEVSTQVRKLVPAALTELYGNAELKRMGAKSYFGTPIVSHSGETIGVVAVLDKEPLHIGSSSESMLDVFAHRVSVELDRKHAMDRLNELNESLELRVAERTKELSQSNEELEAFSYSVSHDLRAPVATIAGFSGLLLDQHAGTLDDTCKRYLQHIADGAQRMSGLIDALLSLAHITRQTLSKRAVDLSALATKAAAKLQVQQPERRVQLTIQPNLSLYADQDLVVVALDNLLGNAWKYTAKIDDVRIELGALDHAGEWTYYVRDNGAGFDPSYAHRLFQPFQRLHHQKEFPGTGIGLATVARIISRHGGRIWAESTPNAGATFYFTLPTAKLHPMTSTDVAASAY